MVMKGFVARSFAENDQKRIQPLLDHLNTFAQLGFSCASASAAESEFLSEKVQRMIKDADVFIAFFTRKYPIPSDKDSPPTTGAETRWVPPSWVLQESGYAVALGKKLVFFKEHGVVLPEIQGDLEYIPFDSANLTEALRRTNEMVLNLVAKGLSIEVQMTVHQEPQSPPPVLAPPDPSPVQSTGLDGHIQKLHDALEKRDASAARTEFEAGLDYLRTHEPEPQKEVIWRMVYARWRVDHGFASGLRDLKQLETEHPEEWGYTEAIAHCQLQAGDLEEASQTYQRAARKAAPANRASDLLNAAKALHDLKRWAEARTLLLDAVETAEDGVKLAVYFALYDNLRSEERPAEAFGVGEYSLNENSAQTNLHFRLGYDYDQDGWKELSLFHYKSIVEYDPEADAALNNMGVTYDSLIMPISSVRQQIESMELGNTLAAANIAAAYLRAGFVADADRVLAKAIAIPDHDVLVDQVQADLKRNVASEDAEDKEVRIKAIEQRGFFKKLGGAVINPHRYPIAGKWKFPFGEIDFRITGEQLKGSAIKDVKASSFALLLGDPGGKKDRTESYQLRGTLTGRVCEFGMTVDSDVESTSSSITHKKGHIIFDSVDSATVMETKPTVEIYSVSRVKLSDNLQPLVPPQSNAS